VRSRAREQEVARKAKEMEVLEPEVNAFAKRLMRDADGVTNNGYITKSELMVSLQLKDEWKSFLSWIAIGHPPRFSHYDRDRSGSISIVELREASRDFLEEEAANARDNTSRESLSEAIRASTNNGGANRRGSLGSDVTCRARPKSSGARMKQKQDPHGMVISPSGLSLSRDVGVLRPQTAGGSNIGEWPPRKVSRIEAAHRGNGGKQKFGPGPLPKPRAGLNRRATTAKSRRGSAARLRSGWDGRQEGLVRPSTAPAGLADGYSPSPDPDLTSVHRLRK